MRLGSFRITLALPSSRPPRLLGSRPSDIRDTQTAATALRRLILDWAARARQPMPGTEAPVHEDRVAALIEAPRGKAISSLISERPSRALSLLQFVDAFGEATGQRSVELPELVGLDADGKWILYRLPTASSFSMAESLLRTGMAIGQGGRIPLAVD